MLSQDYIMRMIGQFVNALARVLFSKTLDDTEQTLLEIKNGYTLVGMSADIIETFSFPNILIFVRSGDELQIEKCLYVAELSMIHGDTLNQNDIKKSRTFYTVSLGLFTEALKEDITLYSAELQASIDYVRSQLGENDLPPELVSNLHAFDTLRESIVPSDHPNTLYRHMRMLTNDELKNLLHIS
jgi:hypothetical protein